MKVYTQALPKGTKIVLNKIKVLPDLKNFYLSGGTALSLQLGHRESEDLDFFARYNFNPELLQQKLLSINTLENVEMANGTLNVFLENVKLQFLHYPYTLLEELVPWNDILLSTVIDIACTKLITISMRGSKKDFVDLYVILKQYSLAQLLTKLDEKYSGINYSHPHILKSLVYFKDADNQPMPKMHIPLDWGEVKNAITAEVKDLKI